MSDKQRVQVQKRLDRHMVSVGRYRDSIHQLQTAWDSLTLLSQLSGTGTDMTEIRMSFSQLTDGVLAELSEESLNNTVSALADKAQLIVDIVIRNLFERTADIGFLATDDDIRRYLTAHSLGEDMQGQHEGLVRRFQEYVKKYSVYSNILLLDPQGAVIAQLDPDNDISVSHDPLIAEANTTTMPYVEVFRHSDLMPSEAESLIYACKVTTQDGHRTLGILCLCFRFQNEMQGVFSNLIAKDSWVVGVMLDQAQRVIASGDEHHIPLNATLEVSLEGNGWSLTRFAGREYICVSRNSRGYQGYMGPSWIGHAMIPLTYAFDQDLEELVNNINGDLLSKVIRSPLLFSQRLLAIPRDAAMIQSKLNQSVWNGSIWQSKSAINKQNNFSKILLGEISSTGLKTEMIIEKSVSELYQTVVARMLENSSFHAAMAVDIMDRNLYERANDCRWWAQTSLFRKVLSQSDMSGEDVSRIESILRYINGLYTVYDNLIVFDANAKVIAVSNQSFGNLIGTEIDAPWARNTMLCKSTQDYVVSSFSATDFYKNKPTYIYSAAIRSEFGHENVGGIGIVFDSDTQFHAMLQDAMPHDASGEAIPGSFTLYVGEDLNIIASTFDKLAVGSKFEIHPAICKLAPGESAFDIAIYDGLYFAVGACATSGYREYKGPEDSYRNQVIGLIFIPLGSTNEIDRLIAVDHSAQHNEFNLSSNDAAEDATEFATFYVGGEWYGLPARFVREACFAKNLRSVPNGSALIEGFMQYGEDAIPVVNMNNLMGQPPAAAGRDQQIIIMEANEDHPQFGMLVTSLGSIPIIEPGNIELLTNIFPGNGVKLAEAVTRFPVGVHNNEMLIILSAKQIWNKGQYV